MAELLSKAQYAAIAADLQLRTQAFIDGEFRDAVSGRTFVTTNPATGKQLAEVAACDVQDVDIAVAAAKRVFEDGSWSKLQPGERKHILLKFAQLLEDNSHELAVLEQGLQEDATEAPCRRTPRMSLAAFTAWVREADVIVVAGALPIGANVFLFAQRYDAAQELTTASMGMTTLVSLFTLSFFMLAMSWIN